MSSETIGSRVRRLRLSRHMTMTELARAAEVSKSHVHQIETGERTRMRLTTLSKYAGALGVPEWYIDYGNEAARRSSQEQPTDLKVALVRGTRLEAGDIERVLLFIQILEAENVRFQLTRSPAASRTAEVAGSRSSR